MFGFRTLTYSAVLGLLYTTVVRSDTTVVLNPVADTCITNYAPNQTAGGVPSLTVGLSIDSDSGFSMSGAAVLRFDLSSIPAGSVIKTARLEVYVNGKTVGQVNARVSMLRNSWSEAALSWNTFTDAFFPALTPASTSLLGISSTGWWAAVDAETTEIVKTWFSGSMQNNGVCIFNDELPWNDQIFTIGSREYTGFEPKLTVTYTPPPETGSLKVTISPSEVVSAGAQWSVDGGAWQDSNSTVGSLSVGSHTLSFKDVTGWTKPDSQTVTISAGVTTEFPASYQQVVGSLTVTIGPAEAVSAGAQWRVNGGSWHNSGAAETLSQSPGSYTLTISFSDVVGWTKPADLIKTVSLPSQISETATYALVNEYTLTLSVNSSGAGTVTANPPPNPNGKYTEGTVVTLSAQPTTGYQFQSWTGDASGTTNPVVITIAGNASVTAKLAANPVPKRWLTVFEPEPTGHGTFQKTANCLSTSGESCLMKDGDPYTLNALPASGWTLDFWWVNGNEYDSNNPLSRKITADTWILPVFKEVPLRYWLTVFEPEPNDHGTATTTAQSFYTQGNSRLMNGGDAYVLAAKPSDGWGLDFWWINGQEQDANNPLTRRITGDTWVLPVFKQVKWRWLTVFSPLPKGHGSFKKTASTYSTSGDSSLMKDGDTYTLKAEPQSGWKLDYWWVNGTEKDPNNPLTRRITSDTWVQPVFKEIKWRWLTVFQPQPTGYGTVTTTADCVSESGDSCLMDDGAPYVIQANPSTGWKLDYWWVNGSEQDSNNPLNRRITGDTWVLPVFKSAGG